MRITDLNFAATAKFIVLVALCIAIAGCGSRIKTGYNLMDSVVIWQLNSYLDLDNEQREHFRQQIKDLKTWHRSELLPDHINQLRTLRSALSNESVDAAKLNQATEHLRETWKAIIVYLGPEIMQQLTSLREEQLNRLISSLEEDYADQLDNREETASERFEARYEDNVDFLEDWVGPLTDTQQVMLREHLSASIDVAPFRLAYRRLWLDRFRSALQLRDQPELFRPHFDELIIQPTVLRTAEYQQALDRSQQLRNQFTARLIESLTDRQRRLLLKRLDRLVDDLVEISRI